MAGTDLILQPCLAKAWGIAHAALKTAQWLHIGIFGLCTFGLLAPPIEFLYTPTLWPSLLAGFVVLAMAIAVGCANTQRDKFIQECRHSRPA